jgi:uncharacterized membrane protein
MRLPYFFVLPLVFIGQLLACSLLAWHLLAQISFAYPIGYSLLKLDKHIAEFAPLNRHIHGFQFTRPKDHWELFAQITQAVQHDGEGLANISFSLPNNTKIPLMHSAEIIHLQDVSHLINNFYIAGSVGAFIWIIFFAVAYRQRLPFPAMRNIVVGFCGVIFITTVMILAVGATKIFYWFHTKVFPDGHQWFFYYEDSLMTTLMKAPDIFAFIASLLLITLIIIWSASTFQMARLMRKQLLQIKPHTTADSKTHNKKVNASKNKKRSS